MEEFITLLKGFGKGKGNPISLIAEYKAASSAPRVLATMRGSLVLNSPTICSNTSFVCHLGMALEKQNCRNQAVKTNLH
jgi:hypothetical protein